MPPSIDSGPRLSPSGRQQPSTLNALVDLRSAPWRATSTGRGCGAERAPCAICKVDLTALDGRDVIVGDEAHIRSKKPDGPRNDVQYPADKVDAYANLILLCKAHHKLIDDNADVFPADLLEEIKARHEARVRRTLNMGSESPWVTEPDIRCVIDGTHFASLVSSAEAYLTGHVHPRDAEEADLIATALQSAVDWREIADEIGPSGRVDAAMDLHSVVRNRAERNHIVLGGVGQYRHPSGAIMRT
ncbi:MAG: HNH endonuclease, partial [Acidimicrobiia bacterium]